MVQRMKSTKTKQKQIICTLWTMNIFVRKQKNTKKHFQISKMGWLYQKSLIHQCFPGKVVPSQNATNEAKYLEHTNHFQYNYFFAQWRQHSLNTPCTYHLLYVCKYSCKNKALRSQVDDTEEQSVKDEQRGLVSVK